MTQVTEWLQQTFGEPTATYVSWALALLVVLTLIVIVFQIWRAFSGGGFRKSSQQRLGITAAHAVDNKRRLVVVRRDDVEHLIMIGGPNDILIESGFASQTAVPQKRMAAAAPTNGKTSSRTTPPNAPAPQPASVAQAQPSPAPQQPVVKTANPVPQPSPNNDSVKVTRDMDQLLNEIAGDVRK